MTKVRWQIMYAFNFNS